MCIDTISVPYILSDIKGANGADLEATSNMLGPELVYKTSPLTGPSSIPRAEQASSKTFLTSLRFVSSYSGSDILPCSMIFPLDLK